MKNVKKRILAIIMSISMLMATLTPALANANTVGDTEAIIENNIE